MNNKPFLLSDEILKKILREQSYVSENDWDVAAAYVQEHSGTILRYLMDKGVLSEDLFGQAAAEYFKVPYIDFDVYPLNQKGIEKIPTDIAIKHRMLFVDENKTDVIVTTDNPKQKYIKAVLKELFPKKKISIAYSLPGEITKALHWYRPNIGNVIARIVQENPENAPDIVDAIFSEAVIRNVSDIHFEPRHNNVLVRFRVDGVLEKIVSLDTMLYDIIINRIKVSAHLRIDEHLSSQDGALHYERNNRTIDMRVSIVPVVEGEKIVIRILGEYVSGLALSDIGMLEKDQDTFLKASKKPFGMILVVGPTGSGKTTTLYSLVKRLNKPGVNITTIEDPVEYKIPGLNQIQVNTQTGLTFSKGLRSIVRQDPDVILVGEIRDRETAEIAVNAALSGHLVLSTFHANDAATAIPRLLDMGIEPFLLASTLELVVGQRLVRSLREDTRKSHEYSKKDLEKQYPDIAGMVHEDSVTYYESIESENTEYSPFLGRTALFEMLSVTGSIEDMIMGSPSAHEIWDQAQKEGAQSMFEDGLQKLQLGVTTPGELLRVVEPPKKYEKK